MQLYMSWYIRSFFGFTFLNILYSFKYSCTNIFHRRSLYTYYKGKPTLETRFMGPTRGPSGADRTQLGPMLAPWTLLSGLVSGSVFCWMISGLKSPALFKKTYCRYYPQVGNCPMMILKGAEWPSPNETVSSGGQWTSWHPVCQKINITTLNEEW